jgi:hypothetical protein
MEDLFAKIGLQLISQCKIFILSVQAEETGNRLWEKDPDQVRVPLFVLVRGEFMCVCLRCCHNGQVCGSYPDLVSTRVARTLTLC